jgi:hypothetical protein
MATFIQVRDQVIALTKRPELVGLTELAVKQATVRAHQVDFFNRDQAWWDFTYTPLVGNELFVTIPNIYGDVPQLRTPDFAQSWDVSSARPTENFEHVLEYKNLWDENNEVYNHHFTLFGESIIARVLSQTGTFRLFYYKNPIVTTGGYASWIADMYIEEIAQWAAAIVWNRSGFQEIAATTMRDIVVPFKEMLVTSHLTRKI